MADRSMLSFRVSEGQRAEIERRAAESGSTVGGFIRSLVVPVGLNLHADNGGSSVILTAGEFTNRYESAPTYSGYGWAAWTFAHHQLPMQRRRPWWRRRAGQEEGGADGSV